MKFTCMKSDLVTAVSNVSHAVSAKAAIPVLECVMLRAEKDTLTVTGYDLEIGITTSIEASVKEEGEVLLKARTLSEIIRTLPEEVVSIETDERLITFISSGSANSHIIGTSTAEYPELPKVDELEKITVKAETLKDMIRRTVFAVSNNTAKPIYTGSLFEIEDGSFSVIAIDGFRMAVRKEETDADINTKFVVPGKTQNEIVKLITDNEKDVDIIIGQRHIVFKVENYAVISRLIEGNFIDWKTTIPKNVTTEFSVNTRVMAESVDRMAPFANEKIQAPVRCSINADEIKLSCSSTLGKTSDVIRVNVVGNDVEIGFNYRYLLDALKNTDSDEVKVNLSGSLAPMVIRPIDGDSFTFLVVPVRLSAE